MCVRKCLHPPPPPPGGLAAQKKLYAVPRNFFPPPPPAISTSLVWAHHVVLHMGLGVGARSVTAVMVSPHRI